jgi:hypothetical protein
LIDDARAARGKTSVALVKALARSTARDIAEFDAWLWAYFMALDRQDLWAAVYAICGGCSDDSFMDFRGWLIGRGEAAVVAAVRDPETLMEQIGKSNPRDEAMLSVAQTAYAQVAAGELPARSERPEIPGRDGWPADRFAPGVKWDAAFYSAAFPKLFARYVEPALRDRPRGAITDDRFWEIVAAGRAGEAELAATLDALALDELVGFARWLSAYNQALMRKDVRFACRLVLGTDQGDSVPGFRGWLIAQGREAVHVATHELDGLRDAIAASPRPRLDVVFCTMHAFDRRREYVRLDDDELATIPDRDTWTPDWDVTSPSVAQLRERFPRLTAQLGDAQVEGKIDVSRLSAYERQRMAEALFERAKDVPSYTAVEQLDEAVKLWPENDQIRGARGRAHARAGNLDAALADFDAVLARTIGAVFTQWERSKVRLARGDREGALADARAVADRVDEARAWLVEQTSGNPHHVRHAKFGDGTVVAIDRTGSEPKLVIDFAGGRKTIAQRFVEVID